MSEYYEVTFKKSPYETKIAEKVNDAFKILWSNGGVGVYTASYFSKAVRLVPAVDAGEARADLEIWLERYSDHTSMEFDKQIALKAAELFAGCQPAASEPSPKPAYKNHDHPSWDYLRKNAADPAYAREYLASGSQATPEPESWPAIEGRVPVIKEGNRGWIIKTIGKDPYLWSDGAWRPFIDSSRPGVGGWWPTHSAAVEFLTDLYARQGQEQRTTTGFEKFAEWRNKLAAKLNCEPSITAIEAAIDQLQSRTVIIQGDGKPLPAGVWQEYRESRRFGGPVQSTGAWSSCGHNGVYLRLCDLPPSFIDPPAPPKVVPSRPEWPMHLMEREGKLQWFADIRGRYVSDECSYSTRKMAEDCGWRELPAEGGAK